MRICPHPTPPAIAPPNAPAPRSPSLEEKNPITAPITIAIIRTVSHIFLLGFNRPAPGSQWLITSKGVGTVNLLPHCGSGLPG